MTAFLLLSRVFTKRIGEANAWVYTPLIVFFLCNALTEFPSILMMPSIVDVYPVWPKVITLCLLPLHLVLAPLFWIYVRGITSTHQKIWYVGDIKHYMLALLSLTIPALMLMTTSDEFVALFDSRRVHTSLIQQSIIFAINSLEYAVLAQVSLYIILIIRRLKQYRSHLISLFSSTEELELKWLGGLAGILGFYAALSIASALSPNEFFFEPWESLFDLTVIIFIMVWGLRQKPGLANEFAELEKTAKVSTEQYEHSGLSEVQLTRIANKLLNSMNQDNMYKNAELSLRILASHIGEQPNYLSQTLSQKIGESFFDFVNRYRVEEAKLELVNTQKSVTVIAMDIGFNSRSSFYNAFKKLTDTTPSAYRKSNNLS
jgi:AraC-like DNA-binding protein